MTELAIPVLILYFLFFVMLGKLCSETKKLQRRLDEIEKRLGIIPHFRDLL